MEGVYWRALCRAKKGVNCMKPEDVVEPKEPEAEQHGVAVSVGRAGGTGDDDTPHGPIGARQGSDDGKFLKMAVSKKRLDKVPIFVFLPRPTSPQSRWNRVAARTWPVICVLQPAQLAHCIHTASANSRPVPIVGKNYPAQKRHRRITLHLLRHVRRGLPDDAIEPTYEADTVGLTRSEMIFDKRVVADSVRPDGG